MSDPRRLSLALLVTAAALFGSLQPGLFTIDEPNHLVTLVALRAGLPHLPGTDTLGASPELAFYEPVMLAGQSPPRLTAPPLYAPLALPFAPLGLRGLFLPNILGFVATCALLFGLARRHFGRASTWLVTGTYAFGAYNLEYAQGVWPHMLAVALCTAAFALVLAACDAAQTASRYAALGGLLAGVAMGVRYQEAVHGALLACCLLLWAPRRLRTCGAFALGALGPILASSTFNLLRLGSWNPISKGNSYLLPGATSPAVAHPALEPLRVLWTRIVDYSTHPEGQFTHVVFAHSPHSPAYVYVGAVKKAWLQSLPWALLALLALLLVWRARGGAGPADARTRMLRAASLVCFGMLGMFGLMGYARVDGICFNQRYFLELVPLACLGLGHAIDGLRLRPAALALGAALGAAAAGVTFGSDAGVRESMLLWFPLAAACLLVAGQRLATRGAAHDLCAVGLGLCVVWAGAVHLGDDLPASRQVRARMGRQTGALAGAIPRDVPSTLFTLGYWANAAAPLQLDRPLLIVDALRDETRDAPNLVRACLRQGRRVFVLNQGFRPEELAAMGRGLQTWPVVAGKSDLLEIGARERGRPQGP